MMKRKGRSEPKAPIRKARKKTEAPTLAVGTSLCDIRGYKWLLGPAFARGGFGLIYEAQACNQIIMQSSNYVCKVEPKANGPIFCEIHFYVRSNANASIRDFLHQKGIKHLGLPIMRGHGQTDDFRFMIMDRYGANMENSSLTLENLLKLACQMTFILEYIHSIGYTHNDVKASNIVFDFSDKKKVYLIDYGLACKFLTDMSANSPGQHIPFKVRPKCKHDGTIEFTSLDAHNGVQGSRRSDLEILLYNLMDWLSNQSLPWRKYANNPGKVQSMKEEFKLNPKTWLDKYFQGTNVKFFVELNKLATYIFGLAYDQCPDYSKCRTYIVQMLKKVQKQCSGAINCDGLLSEEVVVTSPLAISSQSAEDELVANSDDKTVHRRRNKAPVNKSLQTDNFP